MQLFKPNGKANVFTWVKLFCILLIRAFAVWKCKFFTQSDSVCMTSVFHFLTEKNFFFEKEWRSNNVIRLKKNCNKTVFPKCKYFLFNHLSCVEITNFRKGPSKKLVFFASLSYLNIFFWCSYSSGSQEILTLHVAGTYSYALQSRWSSWWLQEFRDVLKWFGSAAWKLRL